MCDYGLTVDTHNIDFLDWRRENVSLFVRKSTLNRDHLKNLSHFLFECRTPVLLNAIYEKTRRNRFESFPRLEKRMADHGGFNGQTESHAFAGFLFDLDGTIINTTEAVTKHWEKLVDIPSYQKFLWTWNATNPMKR